MKNLYLPILIAVIICGAPSQARAQMFSASDFQSTSVMTSGTSLPQAAVGGPSLAEDPMMGISGPRRGYGERDEDEDDPERGETGNLSGGETGDGNPNAPIGAVPMLLMLLLAGAYAMIRVRRQACC